MEVTCSSETSVNFQRITLHYILEDKILHDHRCENIKSYIKTYTLVKLSEYLCRSETMTDSWAYNDAFQ
jgi:hypothetical protein